MKKTMIFAAVAALVSLASCQKEDITDNGTDNKVSPVFTASIAGSTKTTVDLTDGKVAWEEADEITVTDASTASAVYAIESIDATTGKATFVIKDGETALGDGPYTATYGTEPATAQTYSATAGKLYMTAPATTTNSFEFTVQCGLMKLNLTKTGVSVKSIAVTSSTDATYTLTCDPAESIASAKDFCIALPEGSYTKIEITNSSEAKATLNSTSGVGVAANHIKPVTIGESKLDFLPAGALKGIFSVSDTKKVHFSQGNLYAKFENSKWNWNFYSEQYGYNSLNSPWENGFRDASEVDNEIDMFTWGYGNWSTNPTGTDYQSGTFTDWGCTIGDGNTWRTLTSAEWQYLLHGYYTNDSRKGKDAYGVTVCGKANCVILLPDDWKWGGNVGTTWQTEGYPETSTGGEVTWKAMEDAGAVCLPAAGNRTDSFISYVGDSGYYWSDADGEGLTYFMGFSSIGIVPSGNAPRNYGFSVRLVTDVK